MSEFNGSSGCSGASSSELSDDVHSWAASPSVRDGTGNMFDTTFNGQSHV